MPFQVGKFEIGSLVLPPVDPSNALSADFLNSRLVLTTVESLVLSLSEEETLGFGMLDLAERAVRAFSFRDRLVLWEAHRVGLVEDNKVV